MARYEDKVLTQPSYSSLIIFGIIFVVIVAGILFFISYKNYNPPPVKDIYGNVQGLCGDGVLDSGELCDDSGKDEATNPYGDQCISCSVYGTSSYGYYGQPNKSSLINGWEGCRGNGVAVCTDHPSVTDQYFIDHPKCKPNDTCEGFFASCNEVICSKP